MDDLPEVGDLVPKLTGQFIELNGRTYFRCSIAKIPPHEVVRIGWRLYSVGDYVPSLDAWIVTEFRIDLDAVEKAANHGY